jgi:hypothetical protein
MMFMKVGMLDHSGRMLLMEKDLRNGRKLKTKGREPSGDFFPAYEGLERRVTSVGGRNEGRSHYVDENKRPLPDGPTILMKKNLLGK